jgi:hypothetical protein
MDRSSPKPAYHLVLSNNSAGLVPFEAEWADWDPRGRLVAANQGKLLAGSYNRHKTLRFQELADFNEDRPSPVPPPVWARRW